MFKSSLSWLKSNEWAIVLLFVLAFIFIRLPGTDSPLHQDEYKWPMIVNPNWQSENTIPHPPLSQFIYRTAGQIVGYDVNFRFVPLFFGTINLLLLYYFLRTFFGKREAIVGSSIWVLSFFSVLASLMVDTDGQIMPFFFLIGLISYYHLRFKNNKKILWSVLLVLSLLLGFFIKVSFLLAIGAIVFDFLWSKRKNLSKKEYFIYGGYILSGAVILALLLFVSKFFFPFFNLEQTLTYWEHFIVFDRNWIQTVIQCVKALFYTSPFIVLLGFFDVPKVLQKTKVFIFFLIFSFIFYIVLFDFSIGALDRYLQLLILPLTVIVTVIMTPVIFEKNKRKKEFILLGSSVALAFFLLQYIPHFVPPLHPKSEWIGRVLSLRWNFLYPFSGGSGPLGFYISFLFIGLSWLLSIFVLVLGYIKPQLKNLLIIFIIPLGLIYNIVFTAEYLFGLQNGSAPKLLTEVTEFIKNNPEIETVVVYNDNGAQEIKDIGKYERRLYAVPDFESTYREFFASYSGHLLYIDIPKISEDSFYWEYFKSCDSIYSKTDGYIKSEVFDCR
ncbi:MAG: glycosyltransferase family 39 protein [Candidatus Paceibacterota bacterium]